MVYAPQNVLTSGGYFLSYSTLHLTELALRYDSSQLPYSAEYERGMLATDQLHPSIHRYVTWMVIGLPTLAQDTSSKLHTYVPPYSDLIHNTRVVLP